MQTTVLSLGEFNQGFLRYRVNGVVVCLIPVLELHLGFCFMEQTISLMHRHQPRSSDGLLTTIPEVTLVRSSHRHRSSVRSFFVRFNRTLCTSPRCMLHHRGVV